jgi:hypothetical protein
VVVWHLDLQLPVQSVPITKCAEVVSSNPIHGEVHSIQHYVIQVILSIITCIIESCDALHELNRHAYLPIYILYRRDMILIFIKRTYFILVYITW